MYRVDLTSFTTDVDGLELELHARFKNMNHFRRRYYCCADFNYNIIG